MLLSPQSFFEILRGTVLFSSLVLVIAFWFRAAHSLDKLLRYQYENAQAQWVADGQPGGMLFWKPPRRSRGILLGMFAGNPGLAALKWLTHTPKWVEDHPEAATYLRTYRRYALYWNIALPIWFALMLVLTFAVE